MQALLHELRTGELYRMPAPAEVGEPSSDAASAGVGAGEAAREVPVGTAPAEPPPSIAEAYADGADACTRLRRCRVTLLTGDPERAMLERPGLAGTAHVVTLATAHTALLSRGLERLATQNAVLAVEVRAPLAHHYLLACSGVTYSACGINRARILCWHLRQCKRLPSESTSLLWEPPQGGALLFWRRLARKHTSF